MSVELHLVNRLLKALAESTDADDFCERLANDVLIDFDVAATYVASLARDGHITMVGSWGYPPERRRKDDRPSFWTPMAITDTIRTGEIQIFNTWDDYVDRYPELVNRAGPGASFVCVPFAIKGTRSGGLGITFTKPLSEVEFDAELWQVIANAGDLLLTKNWAGGVFKSPVAALGDNLGHPMQLASPESLTSREIEILKRIANQATNKQIAVDLKYSESLVRQETVRIFRKLGVKNRKNAALAAKSLGLI